MRIPCSIGYSVSRSDSIAESYAAAAAGSAIFELPLDTVSTGRDGVALSVLSSVRRDLVQPKY